MRPGIVVGGHDGFKISIDIVRRVIVKYFHVDAGSTKKLSRALNDAAGFVYCVQISTGAAAVEAMA